ncbi:MAG TPA: fimbria/pilus periplasmic chaperone [Methylomirabilota bacterium]|nr:fimbria/pilus periplasmic chaperone [Methylomirabilota bacterium]
MGDLDMTISGKPGVARRRFCLLVAALFSLAAIPAAHAFKLVPIKMDFEPAGRGANQAFRLENESTNTVAIQISMLTRRMDMDGKETNTSADDDFIVYPPQVLLKPKQVQTVRVKWVGDSKPEKELAYRILAEQLPVNLENEKQAGAQIKLLIRYLGSVYIVPKGAKADVVLESAVPRTDAQGQRQIELIFHNRGNAHMILRDLRLTIQVGDKTVELEPEALPNIAGENMLAGGKRRFVVPWPAGLADGPLQVSFDFIKNS